MSWGVGPDVVRCSQSTPGRTLVQVSAARPEEGRRRPQSRRQATRAGLRRGNIRARYAQCGESRVNSPRPSAHPMPPTAGELRCPIFPTGLVDRSDPHRAADARTSETAVATRVLGEVLLVAVRKWPDFQCLATNWTQSRSEWTQEPEVRAHPPSGGVAGRSRGRRRGVVEVFEQHAVDNAHHGVLERSIAGRGTSEGREFARPNVEDGHRGCPDVGVQELGQPGGGLGARRSLTESGLCDRSASTSSTPRFLSSVRTLPRIRADTVVGIAPGLGLHRLRGTVRHPGAEYCRRSTVHWNPGCGETAHTV